MVVNVPSITDRDWACVDWAIENDLDYLALSFVRSAADLQLLREHVGIIHAVLFTHYHVDHLFGLDDVRPMCRQLGGPMPLFCEARTEAKIREAFSYAFKPEAQQLPLGYVPRMVFQRITEASLLDSIAPRSIRQRPLNFREPSSAMDSNASC